MIFCGVGETCVHSCFCMWIKTTPPLLNWTSALFNLQFRTENELIPLNKTANGIKNSIQLLFQ